MDEKLKEQKHIKSLSRMPPSSAIAVTNDNLKSQCVVHWAHLTNLVKQMNPGSEIFLKHFDLLHIRSTLYKSWT